LAFVVQSYSIETLVQCFADASRHTTYDEVSEKLHRVYFQEYFEELSAKTIVIEEGYIDRDYLEDYAAYYDRCFHDYERRTHRLHFFNVAFDAQAFNDCISGQSGGELSDEVLQSGYLGFVVVKPLPQSIIGRTCLKTYPSDGGRRHFPSLRTYDVHLFGLELSVRSLAYQEQDTVVAACATSALWSCFQGTGKLFQHPIPPPVEITNWAGEHMPENLVVSSSRAFPNVGLTASQMALSVRRVGLEPVVIGTKDRHVLNGVAYAFLKGKIPCVLVCSLREWQNGAYVKKGEHAVAVTGFSLSESIGQAHRTSGFQLRSERIDKLYCHDDQVGPFARMTWSGDSVNGPLHPSDMRALKTSRPGAVYAEIGFVLLPLYHKIRIPYSVIHDAMLSLDKIAEPVRCKIRPGTPRAEWDIFLTSASDYKASVRTDYTGWGLDPSETLYKGLPRFMWRVTVRAAEQVEMEFLFDATGIANHNLLVHAVSTGGDYDFVLRAVTMVTVSSDGQPLKMGTQVDAVLGWFRKYDSKRQLAGA
jgi:hypothetical protein